MATKLEQQRYKDARIFYAMGARWYEGASGVYFLQTPRPTLGDPFDGWPDAYVSILDYGLAPEYHNRYDARDSLIRWLADDWTRWLAFVEELGRVLDLTWMKPPAEHMRQAMVATPEQIAMAANKMLEKTDI